MVAHQNVAQKGSKESENLSVLEARRIRGASILAKGDLPVSAGEEAFFVPSQSEQGKRYKVTHFDAWVCECLDHKNRKVMCKHIQAIQLFLKLRNKTECGVLDFPEAITNKQVSCPHCNSFEIMKRGTYKTAVEVKQRYKCKECNRRFSPNLVKRTKVNAQMITLIMDLYYKGLSLRDVKSTIQNFYGVSLHHETIRQYVLRFTEKINAYTNKLKPQVSNNIQIDEQKLKTKREAEWQWCWNAIDKKSHFLLANNITEGRSIFEAKLLMNKLKPLARRKLTITTDKLSSYPYVIAKTLPKATHLSGVGLRSKHNNNSVERYHNSEREFDKIRRGFNCLEEWQNGHRLFHNFIRGETTPAMRAGINVAEYGNRWMTLLKKAKEERI